MLSESAMTEAQRTVASEIAGGPRGGVRGPFPAFLRSPELASRAQKLGEFLRFGTSLPPRLSEMAIIITARAWSAQYEWYAHAQLARKGGLDEAIIQAIARRQRPARMVEDEAVVYDFCTELFERHAVGDSTYSRAVAAFGEHGTVEIIGLCGYYVMVAMALNVAQVPLPPGEPSPFAD